MIAVDNSQRPRSSNGLDLRRQYYVTSGDAIDIKKIQDKLQDSQVAHSRSLNESAFLRVEGQVERHRLHLANIVANPRQFLEDDDRTPTKQAVETSLEILKELLGFGIPLESVGASADGGVPSSSPQWIKVEPMLRLATAASRCSFSMT